MKTIYKKLLFLVLFLPLSVLAQSTLEGVVLDAKTKSPLPGVNVTIQGTTSGTSTDFDGKFKLAKVKKGDKIVFSFIGYKSTIINYDNQKEISIKLEEESNQLQEVVVQVGYGSVKKKDATGSVELITSKDFNKGAIVSTDQLIAGKAAGVRITNDGGSPDSGLSITIRGGASLNASNNPLIIIDGVPIGENNPKGVSNPLSLINPNDVESFSILKDASATAIYGVRASNGVILITTKKGTTGAPQFNFSTNISVGTIAKKLDLMDGPTFTKFINEYFPERANQLGIQDPNDPTKRILYNTDWRDAIFRTPISTDYNFSARANMYKKIPFRASIGYSNVQGLVKRNDYKRLSYSFKMTPKLLNDNLKIDINAKGTYTVKNANDGGALGSAVGMDPTKPIYGDSYDNKFVGYYQETRLSGNRDVINGTTNPVALLNQVTTTNRDFRFLGNIEFDYKLPFLRDLRAIVNMGLDASQSTEKTIFDENALATYNFIGSGPNKDDSTKNYVFDPGVAGTEYQTNTNKNLDTYLSYSKNLTGFVTKVDAQAGYSYQNFVNDGYYDNYRFNSDTGQRELYLNAYNQLYTRYYNPLNLQAFFARSNVDLLGRYLFTATFRADASSLFVPEKRWGYFPAVGFAWKAKEETFLKDSKLIQDLKLRAGWGKTGQSNIANTAGGYFPSRLLYNLVGGNNLYLPDTAIYTKLPYDANLTWEKTSTYNLGLDFELFNKSIVSGSFDVYSRKTTDLLAIVPSAPGQGTGATQNIKNSGIIDSKGFEFSVRVKAVQNESFTWTLGGNIAYNYSEVKDLGGLTLNGAGGSVGGTGAPLFYNHVGGQPYMALVYKQLYNSNGQPIVGAYEDISGPNGVPDGKITPDDMYFKAVRPNWTYGFSTNFNYKNWDLSASFRGQLGGQVYNGNARFNGNIQAAAPLTSNSLNNVLNFYNGSANPLFYNFTASEAPYTDYLLEDATFLRCDNISLSYRISKFVNKSSLRLSGSVNNVFVLTKYSGIDPENSGSFEGGNFYPRPRTYNIGVSLDF